MLAQIFSRKLARLLISLVMTPEADSQIGVSRPINKVAVSGLESCASTHRGRMDCLPCFFVALLDVMTMQTWAGKQ